MFKESILIVVAVLIASPDRASGGALPSNC